MRFHSNGQSWAAHWCASREATCLLEAIYLHITPCRYPKPLVCDDPLTWATKQGACN